MKLKNKIKLSFSCLVLVGSLSFAQATVKLEANPDAPTINKNIYGHFAEHLGRCIYDRWLFRRYLSLEGRSWPTK